LTLTGGPLATGVAVVSNNDTGNFQLNHLNFTFSGPASATTTPTGTVSGNSLEFVVDGATAPVLTVEPTGTVKPTMTISAIIGGSAGLTKDGAGIVTLSGANTFTGGLNITAGELRASGIALADGNLGAANGAVNLSGGATLRTSTDGTLTVGTGRTLTIGTGGGTIAASGFSAHTYAFGITGSNLLTLAAGSTHIRLSGDNTGFTGGFLINNGYVEFKTATSLPAAGSILINTGGGLVGSTTGPYATLSGWLGSGRINTSSSGAILLTATSDLDNTNSQAVDMTGYSSLFLGMSGLVNLGAANTVVFNGSIIPAGSTYRIGHASSAAHTLKFNQSNQLTGACNLIVGNGTALGYVLLNSPNDYTLGTTISNNGRLTAANNGALGGGTVSVSAGGGLNLRDNVTISNSLTLNGGPSDTAFGALHGFSGTNIYGGNITVATGSRIGTSNTAGNSLSVSGGISLGANALSFQAGSTAAFAGGDITVITGAITGSGTINKRNSTGTLTLQTANPAWTGIMNLEGGMLAIGNNSSLGTSAGSFTINAGNGVTTGIRSTDSTARSISKPFILTSGNATTTYVFGAASGGTGDLSFTSSTNIALGTVIRKFEVNNVTRFTAGFTGGTNGGINKSGNGTLILNGTSTYTGGTTVTNGALGGTGTLAGTTSVLGTATLAPGDAGTGTIHTGAITVAGTFAVEVNGANCDLLASTGAIDLTGATLTVSLLGSFSGPYVIAEGTSVTGTMTVPPGYAVDISNGTQAILTQTGTPANFASWASANGVTGGPNGDSDNDGIPNAVEYGLNLNFAGSDGAPGTFSGNVVTFNKRTATSGNSDLTYRIEISSDLGVSVPWTEVGSYLQNTTSVISATLPNGAKNFARLRVVVNP
jgi:fibronectin-binding autotransporter adhesin